MGRLAVPTRTRFVSIGADTSQKRSAEAHQQGRSKTGDGTLDFRALKHLPSLSSSDQRVQEGALNATNVEQSY